MTDTTETTQARVVQLLMYDPLTGIFTRRVNRSSRARAGSVAGGASPGGYLAMRIDGKTYKAHRIAWLYTHGTFPLMALDHINGDKTDNRIANLREATPAMNSQNLRKARPGTHSGLLGVNKQKDKWQSEIRANGVRHHLGTFDSPEQAHAAYVNAKRKYHQGCTL